MSSIIPDSMYNGYTSICKQAVETDDMFGRFKRDPMYRNILEHVLRETGPELLMEISKHNKNLDWNAIQKNDSVGNPIVYPYTIEAREWMFSPTTLRYVLLGLNTLQHIQNLNVSHVDMVEIGAGYGGQCYIMHILAPLFGIEIRSYSMYDLPEASALQKKYLSQFEILHANLQFYVPSTSTLAPKEIRDPMSNSFLFSSYALSEIGSANQAVYYSMFKNCIAHGYMVWNVDGTMPLEFHAMLRGHPTFNVFEECPKTGPFNKVITW